MKKDIIALALCAILFACNSEKKSDSTDIASVNTGQGTAQNELVEKVIRTADMRFKVKDAVKTKLEISKIVADLDGSIVEATIQSTTLGQERVAYSVDSLQETTVFKSEGVIIAKIPPAYLNIFSDLVARSAEQVDSAQMQASDQSIEYLRNSLKSNNREEALNNVKSFKGKKIKSANELINTKDEIIDRKMNNLDINEKTKFSTVTLNFYQDKGVRKVIVANDNLSANRPAFFKRLGMGLNSGWQMFQEILLFLASSWVLILMVLMAFIGFRFYKRNQTQA